MEYHKLLIIIGLLLDVLGVILLVFFKPETFKLLLESASEKAKEHSGPIKKRIAIILIIFGFVYQIFGVLIQCENDKCLLIKLLLLVNRF